MESQYLRCSRDSFLANGMKIWTLPETESADRRRNLAPPLACRPKSGLPALEDKPDLLDRRDLKDSKDPKVCEERWDPLEIAVLADPRALPDLLEKTETLDVMEIPDPKEFKDQRENADHQAFLVSQE